MGVYDLPGKKERMQKALAEAQARAKQTADKIQQDRTTADRPMPGDPEPTYNEDPTTQSSYLDQKAWRGIGNAAFGVGDILNSYVNAGIRDADYLTSGGLSGGTYNPYQFGMWSDAAAEAAHSATGQPTIDPATMPPDVRQSGSRLESATSAIPIPGPGELAAMMAPLKALATSAAGAKGLAIFHAVPNLFKKPAVEDLARGVSPDKVWHDWGWEQNAKGDLWTEARGKPSMNETAVRPPAATGALPPRGSDFPADQSAFKNPDQTSMFGPTDTDAPIYEHIGRRGQIPMQREAWPNKDVTETDPRFKMKYGWQGGRVSDFVANPQLYEQPGLEFLGGLPMRLSDQPLRENPTATGLYFHPTEKKPQGEIAVRSDRPHEAVKPPFKTLTVTTPGNRDPIATTQHELTHAAAQEFGLPQGYSWKDPGAEARGAQVRMKIQADKQAYDDALNQRTADYWKSEDEHFDKYGDLKPTDYDETGRVIRPGYETLTQFKERWGKENPMLQKILDENYDLTNLTGMSQTSQSSTNPALAYTTSMGEVSARNAALRDTGEYSPQELRYKRPELTEDVPRRYQWTEDKQPTQVVNPKPAASGPDEGRKALAAQLVQGRKPAGERHQVSARVLRRPFDEMTSTTTETPGALLPEKEFDWNKMPTSSWLTPLWGDKTWAGGHITGVNETKFANPVEMQGGSDFTRRPGDAIWASEPGIAQALKNRILRLQDTGDPVYALHAAMGGPSGDFSQQTTKVINEMIKAKPLAAKDAEAFDAAMRADWKKNSKGEYDFPAVTDWPGIDKLTPEWMASATGKSRAKIAKLFDTAGFPSGPDMGAVRKAVTKPSLLHSDIGQTGESIVKAGPEAVKMITDPKLPHHDYAGQVVGGTYEGKTTGGFPMQEVWSDWMKTRPAGEDISRSAFAFGRSPVIQKFTPELQDRLMKYKLSTAGKKGGLAGAIAAGIITPALAREIFGHEGDDDAL